MLTRIIFCTVITCAASLCGQTLGVPGINDFTLNGFGSATASPVNLTVLQGFNNIGFQVSAASGDTIIGVLGTAAAAPIPLAPLYSLDVLPFSIWLDPAALPPLPLTITTVPPGGLWNLGFVANVPNGIVTTFQFGVVGPGFAAGFGTTQAITLKGDPALPNCTINFDLTCPNIGGECGATFTGGLGCVFAGLLGCYDTGNKAYMVTPATPLTITLIGDMNTLNVFFANQDALSAGTMTFFDGSNIQVGSPLSAVGACALAMPTSQSLTFASPVRSITVTATSGTLWIDTFEINP